MTRRLVLALGLLVLPSGCALVRPTPARLVSASAAPGGPEPEASRPRARLTTAPLTLERALAVALANNPDVVGGGREVEAARARRRQASAGHWPSLEISAAYRHHWHEERLVPARGQIASASFAHDIFSGDVVLTVPLLSGGSVVSRVAASDLLARAAERRLARTREELVFNVKSTFYAILGQARLIEAIRRSEKALTEHLRRTEQLIEAGKAARVDRLNIEVRLAELNHRRVKQRGEVEIHERLLLSLLGVEAPPPGGLTVQGALAPRVAAPGTDALTAAAVRRRPDIKEVDLKIAAQARRVDVARAEHWPVVAARGTYGSRMSVEGEYDDLGFVGLELSVPVFTGFRTAARVEEERAKLLGLRERRRKLVLNVRREIESAAIRIRTARAAVAVTRKSIALAEESLRITRDKAALGHGTAMDVLDAQAALLGAATAHHAALADLHTARALLDVATGGAS